MTRAQEAEENYVIKRELAVVRQQCSTASESLEKARDTIRELQQQKVNLQSLQPHCCIYLFFYILFSSGCKMFNQVEGFFQFSQVDFNLVALMTELPGGGFCLKSLFDYEVTAM